MKKLLLAGAFMMYSGLSFLQAQTNYRVELSVFSEKVSLDYFYGLDDVWESKDHNDLYRYNYGGDYKTLEEAETAQKMLQAQGYKFAKVVDLEAAKVACVCNKPSLYLSSIFFDFNKDNLRNESVAELNTLLHVLKENPEFKAVLDGHTDSKGTNEYNNELSSRRAKAAKKYLVSQGISSQRLILEYYGEEKPIAKNEWAPGMDSPEGRQFNRRVTIQVLGLDGIPVQDMVEEIRVPDNLLVSN